MLQLYPIIDKLASFPLRYHVPRSYDFLGHMLVIVVTYPFVNMSMSMFDLRSTFLTVACNQEDVLDYPSSLRRFYDLERKTTDQRSTANLVVAGITAVGCLAV